MMTFSDMKLRADSIGGEIKRADADVKEATLMRERAEAALNTALDYEQKAIQRAADKRLERENLAESMASYIKNQGEEVRDQTQIFQVRAEPYSLSELESKLSIPGDNADSVPVDQWNGSQP